MQMHVNAACMMCIKCGPNWMQYVYNLCTCIITPHIIIINAAVAYGAKLLTI